MDKQRFIVHLDSGAEPGTWNVRTHLESLADAILVGAALCSVASHWIEGEEHLRLLKDVQGTGTIVALLIKSILWHSRSSSSGSGGGGGGRTSEENLPTLSAVVEVLPLGVQLSTMKTGRKKKGGRGGGGTTSVVVAGTPRFLPREDIYDVIVNEIVLGRSVESKVMFRLRLDDRSEVKKDDESGDDERRSSPTIFQLLRDGSIELVDAFPPVKLSHAQCLSLCEGISDAIRRD